MAIVPWLVIGAVDATGEQDREDAYFVRAIFDNASSLVQGEDVKIAGAAIGVVDTLEVTDDEKAAVVLRIDDDDFTPWKSDATCTIRPQSLIGEKFVECTPGTDGGAGAAEDRATATARASTCCPSRTTARRWTST